VAILNHTAAKRHFEESTAVVGQLILTRTVVVVGVAGRTFAGG
jgi:hypothetical protein